jgi:hypothetical protein
MADTQYNLLRHYQTSSREIFHQATFTLHLPRRWQSEQNGVFRLYLILSTAILSMGLKWGPAHDAQSFCTALPILRILRLISSTNGDDLRDTVLWGLKMLRLTALSVHVFTYSTPRVPDEMARHLLCLEFSSPCIHPDSWNADDLLNLRCLHLRWHHMMSWAFVHSNLPMKRIVALTCNILLLSHDNNLSRERPLLDTIMGFTLDPIRMPNLKSFILDMEVMTRDLLWGKDETGSGL